MKCRDADRRRRGFTIRKMLRAVVGAMMAVSVIVGPGLADPDADRRPTFTKGKFGVPINQEHIKDDWTARGYSTPKVETYPAGWSRGEHTHGVSLIMTLVTGRMEFIFAGHRVVVEPGDELLYPAHTVHAARNIHDGTTEMMESHKR
jgi:mannose-6-phosphate isomerase-like protein (cupin superfamily)